MPEPSVSRRLLEHLAGHPPATARELSELLDVTPADIRYHLALLTRQGQVQALAPDSAVQTSRGRPAHRYTISSRHAPHNLPQLCDSLLQYVLRDSDPASLDVALSGIAEILAGEALPGTGASRLKRATTWLSDRQYQARWEARRAGPVILFHNCPYAQLLEKHPRLCQLDALLLARLLGLPARQTSRIQPQSAHPGVCIFEVG